MATSRPPYLLRVSLTNFRSLKKVDLELGALNVLVGHNGAGKSNLLDVFAFLGDAVRQDLTPAILKRGGYERIRFRGDRPASGVNSRVRILVEAAVTKNSNPIATDTYTLDFEVRPLGRDASANPRRTKVIRRQESFLFKRTAGPGRRITVSGRKLSVFREQPGGSAQAESTTPLSEDSLGLATLPKLGPQEGGAQVQELGELFAAFRVFDVDVPGVRIARDEASSVKLADNAVNLAPFLRYLSAEHEASFRDLVSDARLFVPGLEDLVFEDVGGSRAAVVLKIKERGLVDLTDLADASYGSVRALALLALLYDPSPPKLTCIEEIDHGLHPYLLDRLVELLREASRRTQIIVATHSPALVNRLSAHELVVCERNPDGSSNIPAISPDVVRKMEQELDGQLGLGELWFTGALGGVPE